MSQEPCDVFVSYHSTDREFAECLAEELRSWELSVWIDTWDLQGGRSFIYGMWEGQRRSRCTVVLIGPSGLGRWEKAEIENAVRMHFEQQAQVVPVILPEVTELPELPPFLSSFPRVDFRSGGPTQDGLDTLVRYITGRRPMRSISQFGTEFPLRMRKPDGTERTVQVHALPNPRPHELLDLTWATFGEGVDTLRSQIENYGHRLAADAVFGINDAGLVIATFLNSSVLDRTKVGYVRTRGAVEGRRISQGSVFPRLRARPTIVLVDFEVKSGGALKVVVSKLRKQYDDPKIYAAVFGAMTTGPDLKLDGCEDLSCWERVSELEMKALFLACTMHPPGIEPPLGLR